MSRRKGADSLAEWFKGLAPWVADHFVSPVLAVCESSSFGTRSP
jgi:hypothetical protein